MVEDDFDGVAVSELLVELGHFVVDHGSGAFVADVGVDGVGEVYGCGVGREVINVTFGGEDEDAVLEDVDFSLGYEFTGVFDIAL